MSFTSIADRVGNLGRAGHRRYAGRCERDEAAGRAIGAVGRRRTVAQRAFLALACAAVLPADSVLAHGNEARLVEFLSWKPIEHVARIFGANRAHLEGVPSTSVRPQIRDVEGESCIVGSLIAFDVDDAYAFDIDEPVELTLTFAAEYTAPLFVGWDMSGGTAAGVSERISLPRGAPFADVTLTLDRARFAGQGTQGADVALGAPGGMVLCDISIERSGATPPPAAAGDLKLTIVDADSGILVPARVGLFDATGRAPLASDDALMLQRFADELRMLAVNDRTFWPSANRQAFYVDGTYSARLPAGEYEIVVSRGPEYRVYHDRIRINADRESAIEVELERYADMPAAGWYSGDAHIHVTRDEVADPAIWGFVAAENVHVGNLLEMGNIQNVYFKQPQAWGRESRYGRDGHFIVSGQEGPRTRQFGHTIHFNVRRPVHLPTNEYFQYDRVFEDIAEQGGISGFAHRGWNNAGEGGSAVGQMNRGMVLLAPFGLVDFVEVLQGGRLLADGWYRLLNLGYRVVPAAGTDWPYSDLPGVVRNYVEVGGPLDLDAWFDAFEAGRTFVTNGPLLEFTINGEGMGREIRVERGAVLDVAAVARLNPDVDALDRLELVVLGDTAETVMANGSDRVELNTTLEADSSMWIAVRAYGARQDPRNTTIAHSNPIYVVVGDEPTWKREAVPEIVGELRGRLERILTDPHDSPIAGNEPWETRLTLVDEWLLQQPLLRPRVEAADALYRELLDRWATFAGTAGTASR